MPGAKLNAFLLALFMGFCGGAAAMSVEEEVKLGQQEHQKIVGQFGIYRDTELQAYINKVGQRVADESSREERR